VRLADILDIPSEKLEAIGRGIPTRKIDAQEPQQADNAILQMLLAPGRDMVRVSYMMWVANQHPLFEEKLRELTFGLNQALSIYHGEFRKPAQQLLAYTHQMRGRIALDRLDFAVASGHYSEMIDLGHELNDADIITTGMTYRGSLLRKRGLFDTALRSFEATEPYAKVASPSTQGLYYINISTLQSDAGHEKEFLQAIDSALELTKETGASIDSLANEVTLEDILRAKAGGLLELWKPEEAIEIFNQTDRLRTFRPLREQGMYTIYKGEAHLRMGDLDQGVKFSLKGLQLASEYRSRRHVGWVERAYNRLPVDTIGKDKRLTTLREAIAEAQRKQAEW
jgi:tetratricopeptide (TPR) repeat protein